MDRLVCGDVGYGKTEIAVRAAFKAVQDGKQVAVLVPTTLLVQQHSETFAERYAQFPVGAQGAVPVPDRRRGQGGARRAGRGQHRRRHRHPPAAGAGDAVQGPRAGGRRRGAALRRRAQGAAQAPAGSGRRAGDVGDPDPAHAGDGRSPASARCRPSPPRPRSGTRCSASSAATTTAQVTAAIRRELLRDGQVFYIHNRVQSMERAAERLRKLVPEARIATAHGQMGEHLLEQVMVDFWEKRFDVLVCTTIVESGLDVSNANTMIIERADALGLSQLHQLRGRVGRGRERGVRVLPLPAGQAAHRDRARPAGDHRAALRARRRHGGRDEGPRDPGCRQPARRRAVRPHRRRRVRPVRAAGRRGGRRSSAATVRARSRRPASSCRSTHTCRTTTSRASGCGWRPTSGWRRCAPRQRSPRSVPSWSTATASRPRRSGTLLDVARLRARIKAAGLTDVTARGQHIRFGPVDLPESGAAAAAAALPEDRRQARRAYDPGAAARTASVGGAPLRDEELLDWCRRVVDDVLDRRPDAAAS